MGQWAQTVHMFPTHITSQLGNAHSSQPLILLFFPVGFVREMSLPAPDLRKGSAPCVPDGLSSRLGFDQGKEAAGGWLLPQNVAVEAFGRVWKCFACVAPVSEGNIKDFFIWGDYRWEEIYFILRPEEILQYFFLLERDLKHFLLSMAMVDHSF